MEIKAVLFDLDGTLVLSNDAHARAWTKAFNDFGVRVTFEQMRPFIGMGGQKIIERVAPTLSLAKRDALKSVRKHTFLDKYFAGVRPAPGASDLLRFLRERELRLALATSAEQDELEALLRAGDLEGRFDAIASGSDAPDGKPDPDIVQAALQRVNAGPGEALMVGDAPYDVEAARRANIRCVALRCGGWPDKALGGAIAIYDDPADMLRRYDQSPLGTELRAAQRR